MIKTENLRLRIKGKDILKGINLHLEPGDIYGLLGPNGAGKVTSFRRHLFQGNETALIRGAGLFYLALFGTPVVLGFGYLAMALSARTGGVMT